MSIIQPYKMTSCSDHEMRNVQRCAHDGFSFPGPAIFLPKSHDIVMNIFTYENLVFCSPSCAKGYLFHDARTTTSKIQMFSMYCRNVLGIQDNVEICPDICFIKDYMIDQRMGITIEEFRATNTGNLRLKKSLYVDTHHLILS